MKILIENNKAKWVDGEENGRWQNIKSDDKGKFIRKGTDIIYIDGHVDEGLTPSKDVLKEQQPTGLDEHSLKIFHAYWESKPFWEKRFQDVADGDYYYYRGLCAGMSRSYFNKKSK